ncbi:unnamed protein product [Effrenium voratum]|nr:unnamed protein product [Effrenium voratum]
MPSFAGGTSPGSLFLCKHGWGLVLPPLPSVYYLVISVCLVAAYCLWDEANYQKCYFRADMRGQLIRRDLFPTFRHIENPRPGKITSRAIGSAEGTHSS